VSTAERSVLPGRRPWVGWTTLGIAVIHLVCAPLFYGPALVAIIAGGVVNAVNGPGDRVLRAAGFWYVVTGLAALSLGLLIIWIERTVQVVPRRLAWLMLVIAVFGIVLTPASGFWLFLVPATIAFVKSRRAAPAPTG
jgi:hypothetical protein